MNQEPLCFSGPPLNNNSNNTTVGDEDGIKQCVPTPAKLEGNAVEVNISSSCRVCNGSQPPHVSILHFRNVVYARSLSEMCAARHEMVLVACGCAAHTVFAVPVAPQMFRCRGGSLSRAHSVGRPPCTPRRRVTTRESFFLVAVVSLSKKAYFPNRERQCLLHHTLHIPISTSHAIAQSLPPYPPFECQSEGKGICWTKWITRVTNNVFVCYNITDDARKKALMLTSSHTCYRTAKNSATY